MFVKDLKSKKLTNSNSTSELFASKALEVGKMFGGIFDKANSPQKSLF
jgi:hypothetical protein